MTFQRRKRTQAHMPEISLTPLIDTALTLLVIFMVTTPIMHQSLSVELPQSSSLAENKMNEQDLVVEVDAHERILLNGQQIAPAQLTTVIAQKIAQAGRKHVFVNGDHSISYGSLIHVVDQIKSVHGVSHVVLSTKRA